MAKRKTKEQREAEQLEALALRVTDIYSGACGYDMGNGDGPSFEDVGRIIEAVRDRLGSPVKDWWGFHANALRHWTSAEEAAEFLFNHDFRADKFLTPPSEESSE